MNEMIRRASWLAIAGLLALLMGLAPAPTQEPTTPQERFDALVARMRKDTNDYFKENWKNDLTDEQKKEVRDNRPGLEFVPEFEAVALEAKGTDVAASARMQIFSIQCGFAQKAEAEKTLRRLLSESIESKALQQLPDSLRYEYLELAGHEQVQHSLETLLEKSPLKEVKASSLLALGQMNCDSSATDAQKAQGRKYFARLIAEFGDVKSNRSTYKKAAESFLFELDHLQVGMVAPDFESIDENGTKFKLADYRGKVTVIDFWGNW